MYLVRNNIFQAYLLRSTGTSPLAVRPPPFAYTNHDNVEIEVQEMDNIDYTSNLMFGNPIYNFF